MEQEEKKQKSQAAENQASCSPLQPVEPHPFISVIPLAVLITLIILVVKIFPDDALAGASQVALMIATAVCVALGMGIYRMKWNIFEEMIKKTVGDAGVSILILLLIGMMSATWMISGVVPTLIYYGVQIMSPTFFLPCACIISSIISVMTGTSWTTIATIGIALMGIGDALGIPAPYTAGAIISGAYFGDKISPLSDTTVLASSVTDTPLFKHIKYMMITTVPSMIITLTIFTVAGFAHEATATDQIAMYSASLKETFHISLWLLIVPVITGILIAKRIPSIITLFISATLAGIFALFFQPHLLQEISGLPVQDMQSQFKGLIMTFYGSTQVQTGNPDLNDLVSTRGMSGMMNTIWLIICAMCFGGAMTASGMLGSITSVFIRFMKRTVGLVASTVASGLFLNICTADQYISIILTGNMFKDIYQKKGYESRLLSRTTEDAVTVTSVLIPWNTCGMTQATILGVATFTYLPYCFFNLISPLMSITVAAIGFKIKRINEKAESIATD